MNNDNRPQKRGVIQDGEGGVFQLEGRNPILEALKNDKPIDTLLVKKGEYAGSVKVITAMAREKGILIKEMSREKLDEISKSNNHQGIIAMCSPKGYVSVDEILEGAASPLVVILDGITDPHNFGAIIRTAEACGVSGIIIPKRRAAGLSPVVGKASAGALEYVKIARVSNLVSAIKELKARGLWIYCADMEGGPLFEADISGPAAIVVGGEGEGVSRLVRESCDFAVRIPMLGKIGSLNASVAAALMMYEAVRKRGGSNGR